MSRPAEIVRTIAAFGLRGAPDGNIVIDPEDNDSVLHQLREHRIEGVAVRAMANDMLDSDEDFRATLIRHHDETMVQTLRVEIKAVAISELLTDHGIDHRLLKGSALAHTVAFSASERSFRDVDVLIPATSIDDAVAIVEYEGATRQQPQLRPGFDQRFGKSVTMSLDGVEVDLHRVLAPGPFGVWMRPSDLFLLGTTVEVGGAALPTLDRTEHLVHACYHAALGSAVPALVNLRDIALLADDDWDVERLGEMIDRWRGHAVMQRAVRLVEDELGVELGSVLRAYRHAAVDSAELAAIDPYLTADPQGRFASLAPSTLRALPLADRPAFALAVGLPDGTAPVARVKSLFNRLR